MKKKFIRLYGAYGANTRFNSMKHRCPNAAFIGKAELENWDLEFRGVADIAPKTGKTLEIGMWAITAACERALDHFEGFPHLYIKKNLRVMYRGEEYYAMFYIMNADSYRAGEISPPPKSYYDTLYVGYKDCGISHSQLFSADGRANRKRTTTDRLTRWTYEAAE